MSSHPRHKHIKIKEEAKPTNHAIIQDIKNTNVSLGTLLLDPQPIYLHHMVAKNKKSTDGILLCTSLFNIIFSWQNYKFYHINFRDDQQDNSKDRSDKFFFFFLVEKEAHTHRNKGRERGSNTKAHHKLHSKVM